MADNKDLFKDIFGDSASQKDATPAVKTAQNVDDALFNDIFGDAPDEDVATQLKLQHMGMGMNKTAMQFKNVGSDIRKKDNEVEALKKRVDNKPLMSREEVQDAEVSKAIRQRMTSDIERERLQPLYDYLTTEGEAENNIPRGEDLVKIVGANSGATPTGADYDATNRLRAMYMLDPSIIPAEDGYVKWTTPEQEAAYPHPKPTAPIMIPSEDGLYHIGDKTYSVEDMTDALAGIIPYAQHDRRMQLNSHYRDDYARSLGYKSWDDAYTKRMDALLAELDDMEKEATKVTTPSYRSDAFVPINAQALRNNVEGQRMTGDEVYAIGRAKEFIEALKAQNLGDNWDAFTAGLEKGFSGTDLLTMGGSSIAYFNNLNKALEKANSSQPLTPSEQTLLNTWSIMQEADEIHDGMYGKRTKWANIGENVGGAATAIPEFAVGMALTGGIGPASKVAIKSFFNNGIKQGLKQTMKHAGSRLGVYAARSAASASVSPMAYSTYLDRRTQQYHIGADGKVVKDERPWAKDLGIAYVETFTEYLSEYLGYGASRLLDITPTAIGKLFGMDKWAGKRGAGNVLDFINAALPTEKMRNVALHAGFSGMLTEAPSEILGDVMNSLMLAPFSEEYGFEKFADKEYYEEVFMTTVLFGGAMSLPHVPKQISNIYKTNKTINRREAALGKIQDVELRNNLKSVMSLGSMEEMSQAMVDLHIEKLSPDQAAAAIEYLSSATMVKVMTGAQMEDTRMMQMDDIVRKLNSATYKGKDGSLPSDEVITVQDKNGRVLFVEAGDVNNTSDVSMLKCKTYDAENRKWVDVAVPASEVVAMERTSVEQAISTNYQKMFGTEIMAERLKEIEGARKSMEDPSAEVVRGHYLRNGLKVYDTGAEISLADGRTAVVESMLADGSYLVLSVNPVTQTEELYEVPFMQVLQPEASLAEAQKQMFAKNIESATQSIERAEATEESEAEGMATEEDVDAQMEDIVEQAQEMPKPVPTREDGSVDLTAIDDPKMFATEYTKKMGGEDKAKASVAKMAANARAEASQLREKSDKMTDPNEVVDAVAKADAMDARADFYDKVLAEYAPQEEAQPEVYKAGDVVEYDGRIAEVVGVENEGVVIADAQGRMTVVDPTTLSRVAEAPIEENAADPIEEADDKLIEEAEAGIVQNVFGKMLDARTAKVVDAMAKALGVKVAFVESVTTQAGKRANADIKGNVVRIAWAQRRKAISFLAGHEFTHRMKDMSPEAYAEFTKSVKKYLGEAEWQRRMDAQRATYESHNRRAEAEGKPLLSYEDTLLEEEVVADFVGELVEKRDAFDRYVQKQSQKPSLLRAIKKVLSAIGRFFRRMGAQTEAQRMEEMIAHLDTFINKAREDAKKNGVQESGEARSSLPSLVGVHNLSLDKLRKVIKMGGLANPSVAVIDVDKQTHVDYGEYSLILPKNMVDARQGKNAGTWAGDAWTPTYPQVVKRMNDDKAISRFYKDIDALPEAMRSRVRLDFDSFMDGRSANALAYWYLFEKGNAPEMVLVPSRYSNDVTNAVSEATKGSFSMFNLTPEERAKCLDAYIAVKFDGDRAAFEAEMQARIERLAETIETKKSDRVKKWAQDTIDSIKEYGFDYDDVAEFIRDVEYDAREKGKVDVDATITAARERIKANDLEADYDTWRNNLDERYGIEEYIFDGYTNSGNRRYLPHTVENASKWMKKQGRQGAVATFPSFGTFVAVSIPKMTTLESIRKRKALLGKSKEEYDAFREKWENVYYELGKKLQPDAKSFEDYGYWRLIEAVGQKNPKEFIKKEYGIELSEEEMTQFNEMLNAIRTEYPARYFETKFERPLQLSDFTAAVVPNDMPLDVESLLKDAGVEVFEYDKGDNASRAEAMQKASQIENVRFSLIDDTQAAAEVVPYLEAYNNDLTTFNALVNKVNDVAEKYPNATWPERFLDENYEDESDEDFINRLKWTISNYAVEEEKDYSEEKQTIEETFGGIWIDNTQEFAKFAKAVNDTPFEENGEGIAYTDNYFYAYYRSIDGQPIPFASVYMNKGESQDVVNQVNKDLENVRAGERVKEYLNRGISRAWTNETKNNANDGDNSSTSFGAENGVVVSDILRKGRYFDNPELYSEVKRTDSGSTGRGKVRNSLITPEMDASYLDAVERGDMATAQKMVVEAAKMAMPNTKVVDENGNPKVVRHSTWNDDFYVFNIEHLGESSGDEGMYGAGFYFGNIGQTDLYGDREIDAFLNIHKPKILPKDNIMTFFDYIVENFNDEMLRDVVIVDSYRKDRISTIGQLIDAIQEVRKADANGEYNELIDELANYWSNPRDMLLERKIFAKAGIAVVRDLQNFINKNIGSKEFSNALKEAGYDGVVYDNREYVAFNPNQIKSADSVTYDDNGNVIPLSERFNPKKEDIRYSISSEEDARFERKVDFLTDLVREYNIPLPTFIAQTKEEFKRMALDYGIPEKEIGEDKCMGSYASDDDIIIINGGLIKKPSDINNTLLHEYAHYVSDNNLKEEIAKVAQTLNDSNVKAMHTEFFEGNYDYLDKEGIIDEVVSYMVGYLQIEKTKPTFEGKISTQEHVDAWKKEIENSKYSNDVKDVFYTALPLVKENLEYQKKQYGAEKANTIVIARKQHDGNDAGGSTKAQIYGGAEYRPFKAEPRVHEASRGGQGADAQEVGYRHSIEEIIDTPSNEEYKQQMLELAKQMERDAEERNLDKAQEIADVTGWVHLDNDTWQYYGNVDITEDAKESTRVRRWLESKAAVKKARTRKMYDDLLKEQKKMTKELESESKARRSNASYAKAVDAILQGQAHEALPIEDQILVDVALGQKLRWEDEQGGSRRGLKTELGLRSTTAEGMAEVTGGNTYIEDYVAAVVERNNGYENSIDDNDVRNAVIEVFGSYPSRKAALAELSRRYPDTALNEATEAIAQLEQERDEALAQIDADLRSELADAEANPLQYERAYEEEGTWNLQFDIYTGALRKARNEVSRMERDMQKAKLTQREKTAAMRTVKRAVVDMLKGDLGRYTRKRNIQALMDAVNEAQTLYAMQRAIDKAMLAINELRLRKETARMNNLLKMRISSHDSAIDPRIFFENMMKGSKNVDSAVRRLMNDYWRGVNSSGVDVAKGVDGDTAKVLQFIREHSNLTAELGKAPTEGDILKRCEAWRKELRGEVVETSVFSDTERKEIETLSPEVRERMADAVSVIEGYLMVQYQLQNMDEGVTNARQEIEAEKAQIKKLNKEIKALQEQKVAVTDGRIVDAKKEIEERKKKVEQINRDIASVRIMNAGVYIGVMPDILDAFSRLNAQVESLLMGGRVDLADFRAKREAHKRELVNMVLEALDIPEAQKLIRPEELRGKIQKVKDTGIVRFFTGHLGSFDYMTRKVDRNAPNGEGVVHAYLTTKVAEAKDTQYVNIVEAADQLNVKADTLFGTTFAKAMRKAESKVLGKMPTTRKDEDGKSITEEMEMTVATALYTIVMWNQPASRPALEEMGIGEDDIEMLKMWLNGHNPAWLQFAEWVVKDFLPSKRERYNKVYREMNGTDMPFEESYFPIRRLNSAIPKDVDLADPSFENKPSTVTGAIMKRTVNKLPIDLKTSFFGALQDNIVEMEEWSTMAPIISDLNAILSSPAVRKAMDALGKHFHKDFQDAAKVATMNYTGDTKKRDALFWQLAMRTWASRLLGFKAFIALKQLASSVLFLPYAIDFKFWGRLIYNYFGGNSKITDAMLAKIGKGEIDVKQMGEPWININWALKNSPMFRRRWESGVAGNDIFTRELQYDSRTKWGRFVRALGEGIDTVQKWGMAPIAFIDAYTVAAGMRTIYEHEMADLIKDGYSMEEAKKIALRRAEVEANKTQQSSESEYLAPLQMERGATTMFTIFQNAPFAQGRNIAEAINELARDKAKEIEYVKKQEMARLKEKRAEEFEAIEATIAKEKEIGIITTEEQEKIRRKQLLKPMDAIAQAKAEDKVKKARRKAMWSLVVNGWVGQAVFNAMGYLPYWILGDDDEEKKRMAKEWFYLSLFAPLGTIVLGGQIMSIVGGHKVSFSGSLKELEDAWNNMVAEFREDGFFDGLLAAGDFLIRKGFGVDYETFMRMYAGVENMIESGMSAENIFMALNAPDSQVRLLAGDRKEGETAQEYATRIMRLYSIHSNPEYSDYYNEEFSYRGEKPAYLMSDYMARGMKKSWEMAYRSDVMRNKGLVDEWGDIVATEDKYEDAVKALGFKVNSKPSDSAGYWRGEYVPPIEGLTEEDFRTLRYLAGKAAGYAKRAYGYKGNDENEYLKYVRDEMEAKRELISEYNKILNK